MKASVDYLIGAQPDLKVNIKYGDASRKPKLSLEMITKARKILGDEINFSYVFFGENLGSAAGHNKLAKDAPVNYLITVNPDVVIFPNTIVELYKVVCMPKVGMAEAKQIPIEHPKEYDTVSGETSWASTAFCMINYQDFVKCGGFDSQSFFLYCDDVDLSWRMKMNKSKVIYVPSSLVYHDKRLSLSGDWIPSKAEVYFSAESALMMAYKWRNYRMLIQVVAQYRKSKDPIQREVIEKFYRKAVERKLPKRMRGSRKIAKFDGYNYAEHRFQL
jgi:GT2 family glycosyltransferase